MGQKNFERMVCIAFYGIYLFLESTAVLYGSTAVRLLAVQDVQDAYKNGRIAVLYGDGAQPLASGLDISRDHTKKNKCRSYVFILGGNIT